MSKIREGYKQTKVGMIPEEWEKYSFNDMFIFSTGKNIKQNEASPEFDIPCVRYGELYHMYDEVIRSVINRTNLDKDELLFSKGDEILLPSAGEDPLDIGSASALELKDIAIGRTINILRPLQENIYSQRYMSYYINHQLKTKIASIAKGSSISNVYNSDLKKIKIPLPPLKEQQKIAQILSTWESAISKQEALIKVKEQLKKGLMQKLLSGEVRFEGFDGEWEEVRLGDVGEIITGATPPTKEKEYYDNGSYPWITPTDIDSKRDIYKSERYLSQKGLNKGRFVPKGSLLVTCIASIGKNAILSVDGSCNQQINAILPSDKNNIEFLYYVMEYYSEYLLKFAGKSATPILNKKSFRNLKFTFPPLKEQQKIAQVLSSADKEIELLKNELEALEEQKRGLMQRLLSGDVRVVV